MKNNDKTNENVEVKAETAIKEDAKETKQEIQEEKRDNESVAKEYLDQLQRLQAEFINYRQRIDKERSDIVKFSKKELVLELLEVLDNFERALDSMKEAEDVSSCKQGVDMIFVQLRSILEKEGLKAINTDKKTFNPYEHEAISKEHSEEDEGTIIGVFQKGYKLKDKVIRPSKVKISGGKKNE